MWDDAEMQSAFKSNNPIWNLLRGQISQPVTPSNPTFEADMKVSRATGIRLLCKFHREVLQECFESDDLDTVRDFVLYTRFGDYTVIIVEENNEILGGVVLEHSWSTEKKIMLIAWIAVKEQHRGRNIGSLLVEEAKTFARNNGALILLGEVAHPDVFSEENPAHGDPHKRVQFYSRFGCQRLEVPYVIPSLETTEERFGIMLTLFPLSLEQETATELDFPEFSAFMEEFVESVTTDTQALVEVCKDVVPLVPYKKLFPK